MLLIYLFFILMSLPLTWYYLGIEQTRNSAIREKSKILKFVLEEVPDKFANEVDKKKIEKNLKAYKGLMRSTLMLDLMAVLLLVMWIYIFLSCAIIVPDQKIWFVTLIIASISNAIGQYVEGYRKYAKQYGYAVLEEKYVKIVNRISKFSMGLNIYTLILFVMCIFFTN